MGTEYREDMDWKGFMTGGRVLYVGEGVGAGVWWLLAG